MTTYTTCPTCKGEGRTPGGGAHRRGSSTCPQCWGEATIPVPPPTTHAHATPERGMQPTTTHKNQTTQPDYQNQKMNPNDPAHQALTTKTIRTITTLHQAIQQAGGTITLDMLNLTLHQFITTIAGPNNITFQWTKPEEKK